MSKIVMLEVLCNDDIVAATELNLKDLAESRMVNDVALKLNGDVVKKLEYSIEVSPEESSVSSYKQRQSIVQNQNTILNKSLTQINEDDENRSDTTNFKDENKLLK